MSALDTSAVRGGDDATEGEETGGLTEERGVSIGGVGAVIWCGDAC